MDWQPIESVPVHDFDILVAWDDGTIEMMQGHVARDYTERESETGAYLTHWMLLPERPRGQKGDARR